MQRLLPFLAWPRPTPALLRSEALVGLTVGMMMLPQAVAYAQLAGMPPAAGVYASLLPALAGALFSASTRLSVGPTALSSLLVSASLTGLAAPGSAQWVLLAVWLALMAGALQLALGLARFGWLLNLVSTPVLMAFTHGTAALIIATQAPHLLGLEGWDWGSLSARGWHGASAVYGVLSLAALLLVRRWRPAFPSVLALLMLTSALSWLTGFEAGGGAVIGELPRSLPTLALPEWPGLAALSHLVLPMFVLGLVSFLETAASARVDNARKGVRWQRDQDLIGQGLAKLASAFSGGFSTSTSFTRSALNLYAGAQTGWAAVFTVLTVLAAFMLLTPVLRHVPQAVLTAIIVAAVAGLIKPREYRRLWRVSRAEAVMALLTVALTIATAPALYWGVLAGVLMTLARFVYQRLHPRIVEVGLHADGSLRNRHPYGLPLLAPHTLALRMDAALDFATANSFEQYVDAMLAARPGTQHVVLLAQSINRLDATGAETLTRLLVQARSHGIGWHLVGCKRPVRQALRAAGVLGEKPLAAHYRTEARLLAALARLEQGPPDLAALAI
ncbi:SulP family inorganic anion transporter [Ottowia cancrivicina]|uniref:SulP family inorganic anion transporter n=1 Tax=Ottowia cancrivicina TaxID=3040346 RepID=UPI0032049BC4